MHLDIRDCMHSCTKDYCAKIGNLYRNAATACGMLKGIKSIYESTGIEICREDVLHNLSTIIDQLEHDMFDINWKSELTH